MQAYIVNPRKRRSTAKRKASPAQLKARAKFAAMARARSKHRRPARRRSASPVTVLANPAPRRRRRAVSSVARRRSSRRVRRNPISLNMNSLFKTATHMLTDAAVGGAGAIGVDLAMGQAMKVLPDSMKSRYTLEGGINWGYFAAKAGIALAAAVAGAKLAPAKLRPYVMKAAQGSLIVQAYEIERAMLPAELTLGYYNPARVASRRMNGMAAYQQIASPKNPANVRPMRQGMSAYARVGGISDMGDSSAAIG